MSLGLPKVKFTFYAVQYNENFWCCYYYQSIITYNCTIKDIKTIQYIKILHSADYTLI